MNNLGLEQYHIVISLKSEEELSKERRKKIIDEIFELCNQTLKESGRTIWPYSRYVRRVEGAKEIQDLDSFWEECKKQKNPSSYFFWKTKL